MATQKTYKINIDVESKTLGQLENDLANINEELKDVDRNSQAFKNLSKQAQVLNQEIEKTNNQIEGFTLDKRLEAADGAAKLFGGSLSAVVGTLGVLGVESEVFGEFEEKAASAIAVGLGVKDVVEGFGQLTKAVKLQTVAQKAYNIVQRAFNAIMSANPVAIVILSITTLTGLVIGLKDRFEALNIVFNFFKKLVTDVAEAIGLAATEEEKAARKFKESTDQRVKDINNEIKVRKAAGESTVELEREKLEKLIQLTEEGTQERKDAEADLAAFEAQLIKEKEDREAEAAAKAKERREKEATEREAALEKQQKEEQAAAEKKKKEEEAAAKKLEAEKEKKAAEAQAEKERLEANQLELREILQGYDVQAIEDAFERAREELRIEEEKEIARLTLLGATEEEITKVKDAFAKKQNEITKEQADFETKTAKQKQAVLVDAAAQTFGNLSAILGEESKAGKAAAIAETVIRTYQSAQSAYASLAGIPIVGPALGAVAAAAAVAAGIANVQKIKSTPVPGGGGAGGPSISPSRINPVEAPQSAPRQFDAPQTFEQTGPTVKAYVVSGDVRSSSEADAKIERRRTID